MINKNKIYGGFSLIELLVYIAILGILLVLSTSLVSLIEKNRARNQAISIVEQEGAQVLTQITQLVRNSTAIVVPTIGNTGTTLSITPYGGVSGSQQLSLSAGVLSLTLSPSPATALTSSKVVASSLSVANAANTGTNGSVQISFVLTSNIPSNVTPYSKTFTSTASIRRK